MGGSKIVDLKLTISNMMQKTYQQEQQHQQRLRNVTREEAVNRCLNSLIHALQCREGSDCPVAGCNRMKRIVEHTKKCHLLQSQTNTRDVRCVICSQLMQLCIFHTKSCRNSCDAPFCRVMKRKLHEQNLDSSSQGLRTVPQIVVPSSNSNQLDEEHESMTPKRMRLSEIPQQSSSNMINFETLEHTHRQQIVVENE
jgi:hypothetical protein